MNIMTWIIISCAGLFIGNLLSSTLAYHFGKSRPRLVKASLESATIVIGSLFTLLGLLVAFTFSGAYDRFETRRQLIVQEVNAIDTAYLRLNLLPREAQSSLREDFRRYTQSRLAFYEKIPQGWQALTTELGVSNELQKEIWNTTITATNGPEYSSARILLIPALNEMFDIVTTRTVAIQTHPPKIIYLTLALISLTCAGLTGYRASLSASYSVLYHLVFTTVITFMIYLILDMEAPRFGLIRLDEFDQLFVSLAQNMK